MTKPEEETNLVIITPEIRNLIHRAKGDIGKLTRNLQIMLFGLKIAFEGDDDILIYEKLRREIVHGFIKICEEYFNTVGQQPLIFVHNEPTTGLVMIEFKFSDTNMRDFAIAEGAEKDWKLLRRSG